MEPGFARAPAGPPGSQRMHCDTEDRACGKESTVMPSSASCAEPAISTAQSCGAPEASRTTFLRSIVHDGEEDLQMIGIWVHARHHASEHLMTSML